MYACERIPVLKELHLIRKAWESVVSEAVGKSANTHSSKEVTGQVKLTAGDELSHLLTLFLALSALVHGGESVKACVEEIRRENSSIVLRIPLKIIVRCHGYCHSRDKVVW